MTLVNKYYVDEIYHAIFVEGGQNIAKAMAIGVDKLVIDTGLVDGTARLVRWVGGLSTLLQSGYLKHYALATFIGTLLLIGYF